VIRWTILRRSGKEKKGGSKHEIIMREVYEDEDQETYPQTASVHVSSSGDQSKTFDNKKS
jgi:hypothetical protein